MATNMTFVDFVTPIPADWLNFVNAYVHEANSVNNIAALRAIVVATNGTQPIVVRSYYSATGVPDGGGGIYVYDSTDTTSADNGGTVIVASDGSRWKLQYTNVVSVKQFGATGSGVSGTSDSTFIQNGTNWSAASGKTLFFPAATYRLLSFVTWPAGTKWTGEPGTIVYLDPTMTLGGVSIGGINRAMYNTGTGSLSLEGITFQSSSTGLTYAVSIALLQASGVRINNCTFTTFGNASFYAQGLVVFNSTDVRFTNSRFTNNSGDGAALSNTTTNFTISGCEFSSNSDWGLALTINVSQGTVQGNMFVNNTSTATGVDRCTNVSIVGNTMVNNSHGVRVTKFAATTDINRNIVISSNNIFNCGLIGISVEQAGANGTGANGLVTVAGNTINGSNGQGINISDSTDVAVIGNTIYSTVAEGILMNAFTTGWETGRITVTGNKIDTCTYGIRQLSGLGTASRSTVVGNDITAASTSVVGFPNPALVDYIDGNTNANWFDISKTFNVPSGIAVSTATAGGITPPTQVWNYLPIYVGGTLKKIPLYNA